MIAASTIFEYGTSMVSAMMKATAPMTGGMIWPPMDEVASTPPAKAEVKPKRFISGIVNWPEATTLATPEPETVPMSAEEATQTLPGPPCLSPNTAIEMSLKKSMTPAFSMKAPNRMNRKM